MQIQLRLSWQAPLLCIPVTDEDDIIEIQRISSSSVGCYCTVLILSTFYHLTCNQYISSKTLPSIGRNLQILPLPKVKNTAIFADLQLISILCVLSKVYKKLLAKQRQNYMSHYNILIPTFQSSH